MGVKRLGNSQSPSKVLMIEKCDDEARATGVGVENFAFQMQAEAADVRDKTLCKIYPAGTDCLASNWKPSTNSYELYRAYTYFRPLAGVDHAWYCELKDELEVCTTDGYWKPKCMTFPAAEQSACADVKALTDTNDKVHLSKANKYVSFEACLAFGAQFTGTQAELNAMMAAKAAGAASAAAEFDL